MDFAADHFVGGGAAHHGFAGERPTAAGAFTGRGSVVIDNALKKAFYQSPFAALAVLKQWCFTTGTGNLHRTSRPFLIRFCQAILAINLLLAGTLTNANRTFDILGLHFTTALVDHAYATRVIHQNATAAIFNADHTI